MNLDTVEKPAEALARVPDVAHAVELGPVAWRPRLLAALATWVMLWLSQPGLVPMRGMSHWAIVALAPWALYCSRPGRRAWLVEWVAASIGLAGFAAWMHYLLPLVIAPMGFVPAVWLAFAGVLLRRLARRWPLALAAPAAWTAGELVRWHLDAPFSFGWWRLGTMSYESDWMYGSVRVWGVWGLTWVFAAFGGWLADLWRIRRLAVGDPRPHSLRMIHTAGLSPLALAIALTIVVPPTETVPGPRLLIVQPGIEQEIRNRSDDPFVERYADVCRLTAEGLAELDARGEPAPDLVCWGEGMLVWDILGQGALEAFDRGARRLPHTRKTIERGYLEALPIAEGSLVQAALFGRRALLHRSDRRRFTELGESWAERVTLGQGILPEGTSFFSGVTVVLEHDGAIQRANAATIWDAAGDRGAIAGKVHLVPGAEDMKGLERFDWIVDLMAEVGEYIPDFVAADEAAVLPLVTRTGDEHRIGISICYDNAFDDPYTVPLRREDVGFFLVASNEAWYEDGVEMDYMVAFSRLLAVATGRTIVRATNSGISIAIDPAGEDVAELSVDGRREMVRGTLALTVPVPRDPAVRTFFVRTERWQLWGWWLAIAGLAFFARGRGVTGAVDPVSAPTEGRSGGT